MVQLVMVTRIRHYHLKCALPDDPPDAVQGDGLAPRRTVAG